MLTLSWGCVMTSECPPLSSHLLLNAPLNSLEASGYILHYRYWWQWIHQLQWAEWFIQGCLFASAWLQSKRNYRKPDGHRWSGPRWENQLWWVYQGECNTEYQEMYFEDIQTFLPTLLASVFHNPSLCECSWSLLWFLKFPCILAAVPWPKKHRGCQDI